MILGVVEPGSRARTRSSRPAGCPYRRRGGREQRRHSNRYGTGSRAGSSPALARASPTFPRSSPYRARLRHPALGSPRLPPREPPRHVASAGSAPQIGLTARARRARPLGLSPRCAPAPAARASSSLGDFPLCDSPNPPDQNVLDQGSLRRDFSRCASATPVLPSLLRSTRPPIFQLSHHPTIAPSHDPTPSTAPGHDDGQPARRRDRCARKGGPIQTRVAVESTPGENPMCPLISNYVQKTEVAGSKVRSSISGDPRLQFLKIANHLPHTEGKSSITRANPCPSDPVPDAIPQ
jgi:hypothetical protein